MIEPAQGHSRRESRQTGSMGADPICARFKCNISGADPQVLKCTREY